MNTLLVGLPGSGKSTVGKQWAEEQNRPFYDVDLIIEQKHLCTIPQFVDQFGWDAFRLEEFNTVKSLLNSNQNAIIAAGGGFFTTQEKVDFAKAHAHCVFLNTPIQTIIERLSSNLETANRPLLHNQPLEERLLELLSERLPFYLQAHAKQD
jgi:shikimate kinase